MNKKILNSILLLSMMSASSACSSNENINETNKPTSYFIKELKKQGYKTYENILLALYINNSLTIYRKDELIHKEDTLE